MPSNSLNLQLVRKISDDFYVPSYQRGYRWGQLEVESLLNDVRNNGNKPYCLQPIVVKKNAGKFDLIDGQQRLTTIYLIYKYMHSCIPDIKPAHFTLDYATRPNSKTFLENLDPSRRDECIDFYYINQAYEVIKNWFDSKETKVTDIMYINTYFEENVSIIRYEITTDENSEKLFSRLNIGKIPLTCAELVKAMFLSHENSDITPERQDEIALQWDDIERQLHSSSLWGFLTNRTNRAYSTRIDLILDLMSSRPDNCKEELHTFFYFDKIKKQIAKDNTGKREIEKKHLSDVWREISRTFLIFKDWFENHEFYHKIGYLISSNSKTLSEIYNLSKHKTKTQFKQELDNLIKESIKSAVNYGEMLYTSNSQYRSISKLLLLFNVISVLKLGEEARFPFDKFKDTTNAWSLEHIHAQNSEGLYDVEKLREWLRLHIPIVQKLIKDNSTLIADMKQAEQNPKLDNATFEELRKKVTDALSPNGDSLTKHNISNLALLNSGDNAALNNSVFAVKRNKIIELDKQGKFIPHCTKMVFLKYYTKSEDSSMYFWGEADRRAYVAAMNDVLKEYLGNPIVINEENDEDE